MKGKACPVCVYAARGEFYHLRELADFIEQEEFVSAYKRSDGICLPHFFSLEQRLGDHANFPILERLQLEKVQSLRNVLDEFIRKQDHRFRDEITSFEANAWRSAMELLAGKPGVFNNEMRRAVAPYPGTDPSFPVDLSQERTGAERLTLGALTAAMMSAKEITIYFRQPLTADFLEAVRQLESRDSPPKVEVVGEDLQDISHLRILYSAGFSLFYGLGLPKQTVVFLGRHRGLVVEEQHLDTDQGLRPLKNAEDLYLRLLWCRFGIAVLLSGSVKERLEKSGLFCVTVDGKREQWCRFRDSAANKLPEAGAKVELFGWEKWNTRVVEVLELKVLTATEFVPDD